MTNFHETQLIGTFCRRNLSDISTDMRYGGVYDTYMFLKEFDMSQERILKSYLGCSPILILYMLCYLKRMQQIYEINTV